jgi:hypothetical protein
MSLHERYPTQKNPYADTSYTKPDWDKRSVEEWAAQRRERAEKWEVSNNRLHLFITDEFKQYMADRDLPFYSTGPNMDELWIDLEPIEVNTVAFGYDDD